MTAFSKGPKEAGFVEGQNVAIKFQYAEDQLDRLPPLMANLIHRPVAVLVVNNGGVRRHARNDDWTDCLLGQGRPR